MPRNVYIEIDDPEVCRRVEGTIHNFFSTHRIVKREEADCAIVQIYRDSNPILHKHKEGERPFQILYISADGVKERTDTENAKFRSYGEQTGIRTPEDLTFYFLLGIGDLRPGV
ncbi:MAG: hypothetical protein NT120_02075 [Candidatus Aenigmarchaeota archaeon]|nr:hypothetical protein [Candidatus Aenigmarchaeota archaeon]